jgi:superfamily II DNA or RNA helicase
MASSKKISKYQTTVSNTGYEILKSSLTEEELQKIKKDLTMIPNICPGYGDDDPESFELFEEVEDTKVIIPIHYGIKKFGSAKTNSQETPVTVSMNFPSQLRDYQKEIVKTYLDTIQTKPGGIISVGCGRGKCLAENTLVMKYDGTWEKVQRLKVGDQIMGDDSQPRNILSITSGISKMYEIRYPTTNMLEKYTVNSPHILSLIHIDQPNQVIDISVNDFLKLSEDDRKKYRGFNVPVNFNNFIIHKFPTSNDPNINSIPIEYLVIVLYILEKGLDPLSADLYRDQTLKHMELEPIILFMNSNNVSKTNIHIPHKYLISSMTDRQCIVQTLVKYFGPYYQETFPEEYLTSASDKHLFFQSKKLFDNVVFLLRTIGAFFETSITYLPNITINTKKTCYVIAIKNFNYDYQEHIFPINLVCKGNGSYYGFEIDGNRRFLLHDTTVTHNTVMALNIAAQLNLKTLILVHKEFLGNQWRERAEQFLPGVRIGSIQGKKYDVQDKDLVIGMIQSLSDARKDNDFPPEIFRQFGLVIADECHHLGARQFSRVLKKYCMKYTLGLSATPKRADGMSNVFHHYLGDIIYQDASIELSEEEKRLLHIPDAQVTIYEYELNDAKYNKELFNFKKKPNVTVMETNITKCAKRTMFILSLLPGLVEENRNILILSSRLEHIYLMQDLITSLITKYQNPEHPQHTKWANVSVGLYLGGMKQSDLDISATRRIIIATYVMAEEAFDCPSLNTLIMATPKRNIEQAVGRILRQKKADRRMVPWIIDIKDNFSSFVRWSDSRKKYYRKKKYDISYYEVNDNQTPRELKLIKNMCWYLKDQQTNNDGNNEDPSSDSETESATNITTIIQDNTTANTTAITPVSTVPDKQKKGKKQKKQEEPEYDYVW